MATPPGDDAPSIPYLNFTEYHSSSHSRNSTGAVQPNVWSPDPGHTGESRNRQPQTLDPPTSTRRPVTDFESDNEKFFTDTGTGGYAIVPRKSRAVRRRANVKPALRDTVRASGIVWAVACCGSFDFGSLIQSVDTPTFPSHLLNIETSYNEVLCCRTSNDRICFLFNFGCIVCWDISLRDRKMLFEGLRPFMVEPIAETDIEDDDMGYTWSDFRAVHQDIIHLVTEKTFERLAHSYAFAQSVKLSYFESRVDKTIERTRMIPEGLAKTGKITANRQDIGQRIGELFISRFYINLHTDILDTPDIFWENDEFSEHYSLCRRYLEIPKRVDILNQRLDIIKDMYDMLNNELTIQHGYKLEWIVIYLICIEVAIEVCWNIIIRDILKLV
eukprot:Lankesteria_metandrocarpae@DN551_c0_g1_i2.p1